MLAYAVSFLLIAVSRGASAVPGFWCAYLTFVRPLEVGRRAFDGKTIEYIAFLMSGWINIAFLASMTIRWKYGNGQGFRILRTITLAMIPFCWIVLYHERLHPREGHILWVVAMALALFSRSASSSRLITAGSQP
jgi:hypothetical protein